MGKHKPVPLPKSSPKKTKASNESQAKQQNDGDSAGAKDPAAKSRSTQRRIRREKLKEKLKQEKRKETRPSLEDIKSPSMTTEAEEEVPSHSSPNQDSPIEQLATLKIAQRYITPPPTSYSSPSQEDTPSERSAELETARRYTTPPPTQRCPDDLTITPMRRTSPQLEDIVSITSPKPLRSATALLATLRARGTHVQTQISAFESAVSDVQNNLQTLPTNTHASKLAQLSSRIGAFEEIIALASQHWNELFTLEYALRDVIDEESGDLGSYLGKVGRSFGKMVRRFDRKVEGIMGEISKRAAERAVRGGLRGLEGEVERGAG